MFVFRQFSAARLGWRGILGIAAALAIGIALVVLSIGLAIVLVPVVALAIVLGRWRLKRVLAAAAETPPESREPAGRIIEAEYSVIEDRNRR